MNLHRNNAAEWVMWACLLPVFGVIWVAGKMQRRDSRRFRDSR